MAEQDGDEPPADADAEEEDQHRRAGDQPRNGDRREEQRLQEFLAAELVAVERERGHRAKHGRDQSGDDRELEAVPGRRDQLVVLPERGVPVRRPLEWQLVEGRGIERHRRHDDDRQIEEGEQKNDVESPEPFEDARRRHQPALRRTGAASARMISTTASRMKESAAPSGQLKTATNWSSITVP